MVRERHETSDSEESCGDDKPAVECNGCSQFECDGCSQSTRDAGKDCDSEGGSTRVLDDSDGGIEDLTLIPNTQEEVLTLEQLRLQEETLLEKHMTMKTQKKRKYSTKDSDDDNEFELTKSKRRRRLRVGGQEEGDESAQKRKFSVHDEKALQAKKV